MSMDRAQASLQRYLGTVHYEYIPAIKDREFFAHSLGRLQDAVMASRSNKDIHNVVNNLNQAVVQEVDELKAAFKKVADLDVEISLTSDLAELFSAFSISTEKQEVPFTYRGDGIQARFLPSLLHHVSEKSKLTYLWGFEEPENCMEHALATKLANDMETIYSRNAQIIVTSHSPAFLDLKSPDSRLYRVERPASDETVVNLLTGADIEDFADLGLLALQTKFQKEYEQRIEIMEGAKNVLEARIQAAESPVILVECKTDEKIMEEAWLRIYGDDMPFTVECCSTTEDNSSAGCGILKKALESGRPSMQPTIGLFDYDHEGVEAFEKLDKNFVASEYVQGLKVHRNGKFAAMIFPVIEGLQGYRTAKTLCIEFLFPEYALQTKVGGRGLTFQQQKRTVRVGKLEEREEDTLEPHYRTIQAGKAWFASHVVPTLDDQSFHNFQVLFDYIRQAMTEIGADE